MPDPFHVRFNIDVPIDEAQRCFVNRIAHRVRLIASALSFGNLLDTILREIEAKLGEPHSRQIEYGEYGLPDFGERWCEMIGEDFLRCLQALEGFYKGLPSGASSVDGYDPFLALNTSFTETFA